MSWIQLVLGAMNGFFSIIGISVEIDGIRDGTGDNVGVGIGMSIFFLVLTVVFLNLGLKNRAADKACRALDQVLISDSDGYVHMKEIALKTGTSEEKAFQALQRVMTKGCLINATVEFKGPDPVIVLSDSDGNERTMTEFVTVRCPNCGNAKSIRRGQRGICDFCGTDLKIR